MAKLPAARAVVSVDLEDFNASMNWMVYGLPGAGKTSLAASLPSNTFINCEPGIIAGARMSKALGTFGGQKVDHLKKWEDAERAVGRAEAGSYDTEWLTIDTLSTIQQLCFRYWTAREHVRNPKMDEDVPDQGGHQKVQFLIRKWVSRMVDTDYNIMFLCHAMSTENSDGSGVWLPSIEGQAKKGYAVAHYVMALMNAVGYMGVREGKKDTQIRRVLWQTYEDTRKDIIYTAKEQFGGVLGRYTDDLMMPELLAKVNAPVKLSSAKKK